MYFQGQNNFILARIEDEIEQTSEKAEQNNKIISNHTTLKEEDEKIGITNIVFELNKDRTKYDIYIYRGNNKIFIGTVRSKNIQSEKTLVFNEDATFSFSEEPNAKKFYFCSTGRPTNKDKYRNRIFYRFSSNKEDFINGLGQGYSFCNSPSILPSDILYLATALSMIQKNSINFKNKGIAWSSVQAYSDKYNNRYDFFADFWLSNMPCDKKYARDADYDLDIEKTRIILPPGNHSFIVPSIIHDAPIKGIRKFAFTKTNPEDQVELTIPDEIKFHYNSSDSLIITTNKYELNKLHFEINSDKTIYPKLLGTYSVDNVVLHNMSNTQRVVSFDKPTSINNMGGPRRILIDPEKDNLKLKVGDYAFYKSPLTFFPFDKCESYGSYCFGYCNFPEYFSIDSTIPTEGMFYGCRFVEVNLTDNPTIFMTSEAFANNSITNLKGIDNLQELGSAFAYNPLNLDFTKYHFKILNNSFAANETTGKPSRTSCMTKVISNTIEEMRGGCFTEQRLLTEVNCPKNTVIGDDCFKNCTALKTVICGPLTTIGERAFYGCSALETVSSEEGEKVGIIGREAFYNCRLLHDSNFDNVISIGEYAFFHCQANRNLSCKKVTSIGNYAFFLATPYNFSNFPNVTSVGEYAFANSSSSSAKDIQIGDPIDVEFGDKLEELPITAFYCNGDVRSFKASGLKKFTKTDYSDAFDKVNIGGKLIEEIVLPQWEGVVRDIEFHYEGDSYYRDFVDVVSVCHRNSLKRLIINKAKYISPEPYYPNEVSPIPYMWDNMLSYSDNIEELYAPELLNDGTFRISATHFHLKNWYSPKCWIIGEGDNSLFSGSEVESLVIKGFSGVFGLYSNVISRLQIGGIYNGSIKVGKNVKSSLIIGSEQPNDNDKLIIPSEVHNELYIDSTAEIPMTIPVSNEINVLNVSCTNFTNTLITGYSTATNNTYKINYQLADNSDVTLDIKDNTTTTINSELIKHLVIYGKHNDISIINNSDTSGIRLNGSGTIYRLTDSCPVVELYGNNTLYATNIGRLHVHMNLGYGTDGEVHLINVGTISTTGNPSGYHSNLDVYVEGSINEGIAGGAYSGIYLNLYSGDLSQVDYAYNTYIETIEVYNSLLNNAKTLSTLGVYYHGKDKEEEIGLIGTSLRTITLQRFYIAPSNVYAEKVGTTNGKIDRIFRYAIRVFDGEGTNENKDPWHEVGNYIFLKQSGYNEYVEAHGRGGCLNRQIVDEFGKTHIEKIPGTEFIQLW